MPALPTSAVRFAVLVSLVLPLAVRADEGARSYKSGTVQISDDGSTVVVANPEHGSLATIDVASRWVTEHPLIVCSPRGVALREDGTEVWATCQEEDALVLLDPRSGAELDRVVLPRGSGPAFAALSPDQATLVVSLHRGDAVAVVDAISRTVIAILPTWRAPLGVAFTADGRSAWITHAFSDGQRTYVTRVDVGGDAPSVGARVPIGPQLPLVSFATPGEGVDPAEGGAVTLRGHLAQIPGAGAQAAFWLPAQHSATVDPVVSPDTAIQAAVHRLDPVRAIVPPADRLVLTAVRVHDPAGRETWSLPGWDARIAGLVDVAFTADGREAWLAAENSEDVILVPTDLAAARDTADPPLAEIPVDPQPSGLALSPTQSLLLVHSQATRSLVLIDTVARRVIDTLPTTTSAEPIEARVRQGRRVFHTSALPQASRNGKVSCASCHPGGELDGLVWSFQNLATRIGPRATTSMLGLSLTFGPQDPTTRLGQLHRAGDRDEIQDFEHTFRDQQMGGTGFFTQPPNPYQSQPNAGQDPDVDAMAAYMVSLPLPQRSPHRRADERLTSAAIRGAAMFRSSGTARADAGCATCHVPSTGFADKRFHDVGSARPMEETQLRTRSPFWHANTPTLIGLWASAPYDDAGSPGEQTQELVDVLAAMAARGSGSTTPHGNLSGMTRRQLDDLASLLLSLDGATQPAEILGAADTEPPRLMRVEPVSLRRIDCWFDETVDSAAAQPSNWRVVADDGTELAILDVEWHATWGDKVTLWTEPMPRDCVGRRITVIPGAIPDAAGWLTGGSANRLDMTDPSNVHEVTLGDTLTVTLGASGREHETVRIHDAAMAGPDDPDASHDEPWMQRLAGSLSTRGFVRFEWKAAFQIASDVVDSSDVVEARITLKPELGAAQAVQARRMLQPWQDGRSGDFDADAPGAPTWREHGRGLGDWNAPGGLAMGGTGTSAADYFGAFDVAAVVDATAVATSMDATIEIAAPAVTEAFRLWFDEPALDLGYALELGGGVAGELRFARSGPGQGGHGPVLSITYRLPPAREPVAEVAGPSSDRPLLVRREAGELVLSFADDAASGEHEVFEGGIGSFTSHAGTGCAIVAAGSGGRLEARHVPGAGARYVLVGASSPCGGSLGMDDLGRARNVKFSACAP